MLSAFRLIILRTVDDAYNPNTQKFMQQPLCSTHYLGHTLDILISRDNSDIIYNVVIRDILLSDNDDIFSRDHLAICCNIRLSRQL